MPTLFALACFFVGSSGAASESRANARERVVEGTIAELQRAVRTGELSCVDVVGAYLERIRVYDRATGLGAITSLARDAIDQAAAADAGLRSVAGTKPLFCIPMLVKDNIDTFDLPTTAGSIALKDSVPPDDAAVVRALREAGAIVIAKTNMAEWAFSPRRTISSTGRETANAYDLERVPAGSSGGTASAVAASFAAVGLGTDTGNSVRGPSSHLALVGMRPTYGRVSLDGVIPLLLDRDVVGPMTRTVEDNARLLSVMATTSTASDAPAAGDYVRSLHDLQLPGARIGVLRALAQPESMDPQIAALFEAALNDLHKLGIVIVDDIAIEGYAEHVRDGYYCPTFRADVNAYLRTLGARAPVDDVLEIFRQGRYAPESHEPFSLFVSQQQGKLDASECASFAANLGRQSFRHSVMSAMERADVRALAYPTWTFPPALRSRAEADYRGDNSQLVAPSTGLPAITVPMGFTREALPAGLQILGPAWSEATLYALAWQYEHATRHRVAPKSFPALTATSRPMR